MSGEKFGKFVRRAREGKDIGLREMAKMIGVSPTYLSKVAGLTVVREISCPSPTRCSE